MTTFDNLDFFEYNSTKYYCRHCFICKFPETEITPEKFFMDRHKITGDPVLYGTFNEEQVWEHVPGWTRTDDLHIPFHTEETLQKVLNRVKYIQIQNRLAAHRQKYKKHVKTAVKAPKMTYDPNSKVADAPPQIIMTETEMYLDENKKPIDIYMCGDRKVSKCYFLGSSIEIGFFTDNVNDIMMRTGSGYQYKYHYEIFMYLGEKQLFLTYLGMMALFKNTNNATIEAFEKWACETLFIVRHGSLDLKKKLVKKMMGLSFESIKKVFSTGKDNSPLSGIYLMALEGNGVLDHLKATPEETGGLPYKIGCTGDLVDRMSRHEKTYGSIPTCNVSLVFSTYIDPKHKFDAETELKNWADRQKVLLKVSGHKEIVYLTPIMLKKMKEIMEYLGKKYRGEITAIHNVLDKERTDNARLLVELKAAHLSELALVEKKHKAEIAARDSEHKAELKESRDELKECKAELKESRAEVKALREESKAELKALHEKYEALLLTASDKKPSIITNKPAVTAVKKSPIVDNMLKPNGRCVFVAG
jgi:hypothetical protein